MPGTERSTEPAALRFGVDLLLQQVVVDADPERVATEISANTHASSGAALAEVIKAVRA
jgi:hypothetical protein